MSSFDIYVRTAYRHLASHTQVYRVTTFLALAFLITTLLAACGETATPVVSTTSSAASTTSATTTSQSGTTTAATSSSVSSGGGSATPALTSAASSAATPALTGAAATTPGPAGSPAPTFNTPAATPASTATADLPNLVYPGSREVKASDTTSQSVLKNATGSNALTGNFQSQSLRILLTADSSDKVETYYKKTFTDAGYQLNNQQSGQNVTLLVFQKNGVKILMNFGPLGDPTQLPTELQSQAKPNDNLVLIVIGKSVLEPTPAPTSFTIPGSPAPTVAAGQKKIATLTLDSGGVITMELYPDVAPITVENFEKLANRGFYDGLTFHRIVAGFVVQGGDPLGNGSGGPGQGRDAGTVTPYAIPGEFTTKLKHDYGTLAMARSGDPNSAGSQFYIVTGHAGDPNVDNLNGKYAIFGKVTSGMDLVEKVKQGDKIKTLRVENK